MGEPYLTKLKEGTEISNALLQYKWLGIVLRSRRAVCSRSSGTLQLRVVCIEGCIWPDGARHSPPDESSGRR